MGKLCGSYSRSALIAPRIACFEVLISTSFRESMRVLQIERAGVAGPCCVTLDCACAPERAAPPCGGGKLHLLRFLLGFLGHLSSLANVDAQFDADERRLSH